MDLALSYDTEFKVEEPAEWYQTIKTSLTNK